MEKEASILVLAKSGNFRDSLAALLRTIPQVILSMLDELSLDEIEKAVNHPPAVLLVDWDLIHIAAPDALASFRRIWPEARFVIMTDHHRQTMVARASGFDFVISKSTSAGELLAAIRQQAIHDRPIVNASPIKPPFERIAPSVGAD